MNYSFIPQTQKIIVTKNIYDGTCLYCSSESTYRVMNIIDCSIFHCMSCNKDFKSTQIKELLKYETEKLV